MLDARTKRFIGTESWFPWVELKRKNILVEFVKLNDCRRRSGNTRVKKNKLEKVEEAEPGEEEATMDLLINGPVRFPLPRWDSVPIRPRVRM